MREKKYPTKNYQSKIYEARLGGEWWAEWSFHPERKWRFDFACPEDKVAIEIDGGLWSGGRHSGGIGQKKDMEKMNAAAELEWIVFHFTPDEQYDHLSQVENLLKKRRKICKCE